MKYGTLKIYYIFACCVLLPLSPCHALRYIPCLFQAFQFMTRRTTSGHCGFEECKHQLASERGILLSCFIAINHLDLSGYSEQKFSALDKNGIQWACEEYTFSTSYNNDCDGFKSNFTNLVFLWKPTLDINQTTHNGSLVVHWNFDVTETDNSTLGFFLNSRDIMKKKRYCRVILFKNKENVKKSTELSFQTIIDGAGKYIIMTVTPIVNKLYNTIRWVDGKFLPRLNNPRLLEMYFKTRENIANYSVQLLSFPSNETISYKYISKSCFSFKNVSSGKYFFLVTPIDPKPNGQCLCYTGTPRFRSCDRCNSVRSPIYDYPQYDNKSEESGGSTAGWVWPVVGSILMVSCAGVVAVIVYILLKRKRAVKSRSQRNDGRYNVVYVIYTADHSPHVAVVEHLINYLRSYCRCEILCSLESQVETKINVLERLHFIETSVARSDIIMVITSNALYNLFKLYCNHGNIGSPRNQNVTPDDAVEALLHTMYLQKAGNLKGNVVGIQLPYAPNLESCFENLNVDAMFSLPDKVSDFLKSIQNFSTDTENVEKYSTFFQNLKDSISDALKFERSKNEWKENSETENNDSGVFSHSKMEQFHKNHDSGMFDHSDSFHTNKQLSLSKDDEILTQNYDSCISSHFESVDKSLINFIEPDYRSDLETGSVSLSEKMKSINDRYDLATGKHKRRELDLISIGGLSV